ncbi:MAG TPA: Hsp20/alpha crystallin family protein [Bryobacteraceae bacterium]|nr:Hsp20/alpha crystallin family protein [Opitutaceae bacterium]HUB32385.1 Hsp20/alpha crystallin family protein [Bryobacteraceae bacterium]
MSLSHFDPLANLRAFEDAFSRVLSEPQANRPWSPAVDIYETENELVFQSDLPDVDLSDIDVRVENQTLTIAGERKFAGSENTGFHRIERSYGKFVRSFAVPNTFDTDKIAAGYKNGVLTVSLPKKEAAKPRQIKVEVAV